MLILMLLRHAKAAQHVMDDHSRTLTEGGRADAAALGAFLAERGLIPDQAHVSSSARTRETFLLVEEGAGRSIGAQFEDGLYNCSADTLSTMLRTFDAPRVLVVGHNPGIMEAAVAMTADGDPRERQRMQNRFPPCGLAVLAFDRADWGSAQAAGGSLTLFVTPEDLHMS